MPRSLMMLDKIRVLASLYRELGPRWSAFRLAYAFCLRTGLIRLQMPQYKWADRPLETWLKKQQSPAGRVAEGVSRPSELPPNLPWNQQTAIDEADRILNGEIKYFAQEFHQTGFPPNWHQAPPTLPTPFSASEVSTSYAAEDGGWSMPATKHWSQISDDYVIARRVLALPDEAISCYWETALAKTKSASQRHYSYLKQKTYQTQVSRFVPYGDLNSIPQRGLLF